MRKIANGDNQPLIKKFYFFDFFLIFLYIYSMTTFFGEALKDVGIRHKDYEPYRQGLLHLQVGRV